jgi:hypothetical protein
VIAPYVISVDRPIILPVEKDNLVLRPLANAVLSPGDLGVDTDTTWLVGECEVVDEVPELGAEFAEARAFELHVAEAAVIYYELWVSRNMRTA